jgi:hypothetical protein
VFAIRYLCKIRKIPIRSFVQNLYYFIQRYERVASTSTTSELYNHGSESFSLDACVVDVLQTWEYFCYKHLLITLYSQEIS